MSASKKILVVLGKKMPRNKYRSQRIATANDIPVLSDDAKIRVSAAIKLLASGEYDSVCFSGGATNGKDLPSEAEEMSHYFKAMGGGGVDIIGDHDALTTEGNASCSRKLFTMLGFEDVEAHVITNAYHMPRAIESFRKHYIVVRSHVAEDVTGSHNPNFLLLAFEYAKEFTRRFLPESFVERSVRKCRSR